MGVDQHQEGGVLARMRGAGSCHQLIALAIAVGPDSRSNVLHPTHDRNPRTGVAHSGRTAPGKQPGLAELSLLTGERQRVGEQQPRAGHADDVNRELKGVGIMARSRTLAGAVWRAGGRGGRCEHESEADPLSPMGGGAQAADPALA